MNRAGCSLASLSDTALRRMDAHEQLIERERRAFGNHELPVEHERLRFDDLERGDHFREIAVERLPGFRAKVDLAVLEGETAEAVELGFVVPLLPGRQLANEPRLHRRIRCRDRERHCLQMNWRSSQRPRFASSGDQRSPIAAIREGMFSIRKSAIRAPPSSSSHVTGADTVACGVGRGE